MLLGDVRLWTSYAYSLVRRDNRLNNVNLSSNIASLRFRNSRGIWLMAAVLLLGGLGVVASVASEVYSAAMTISAEPLQNATSDGSIRQEGSGAPRRR